MKGLILSGGRGTRLRPITHTQAKQLVPVANRPVLLYAVDALLDAGIRDIGIIVGDTAAEVMEAVGDGSRFGAAVTYLRQEQPLGLAHAVAVARPWLGDEPFVMFLGDNLVRGGITALVEAFGASTCDAMILLARVARPERFGVAELEEGRVVRLVEKPSQPRSDLALVGVYLFRAAIHDAVAAIRPSARGELEITDAIQWLIDSGRDVVPHVIEGWWATAWRDTGNLEDLLEANRIVLESLDARVDGDLGDDVRIEGRVVVEAGAVLRSCTVRGPAVIGPGAVVENAYVGPFTSVGANTVIRNAEVDNCIVMEGSLIENLPVKLTSSLLGRGCVVCRGPRHPSGLRLLVGDDSRVEIH